MNRGVVLVGSYPPPYGGCSVHVARLRRALDRHFDVSVVDLYGRPRGDDDRSIARCGGARPLAALRAINRVARARAALVHFHVAAMDAFLPASYPLLAAVGSGTRTVLTVHSGSFVERFRSGPAWRRSLLRERLRRVGSIVVVNDDQRCFLEELGIDARRISVVPAFLPPNACETPNVRASLARLAGCSSIVVASGYGLRYYGFDAIVAATEMLRAAGERPGLAVCTYASHDEPFMRDLQARARDAVFLRDLTPDEFAWLLQRADAYVRATDRDGDAVAIREALHFGTRVVASDCVARPAGVATFATGDPNSLASALQRVRSSPAPAGESGSDAIDSLLRLYREALAS